MVLYLKHKRTQKLKAWGQPNLGQPDNIVSTTSPAAVEISSIQSDVLSIWKAKSASSAVSKTTSTSFALLTL